MNYTVKETQSLIKLIEEVAPDYEGTISDFERVYNLTLNSFNGRVFFSCETANDEEFAVCFVGAKYPQFFKYSENTDELLGF